MSEKRKIQDIEPEAGANLVILTKFGVGYSANPTEQRVLCNEHYETERKNFDRSYEIRKVWSPLFDILCEICTPYNFEYNNKIGN